MTQRIVTNVDALLNDENEVVVRLADGWTLRSGAWTDSEHVSGEHVRLCDPAGVEYAYWDRDEWKDDPVGVMGAIMNAAAGLRLKKEPKY